jgi:CRP-like cAMP-binding protein
MPDQLDYNRLRSVTLFNDLDRNELDIVYKRIFEQSVKKDSILFMEGTSGEFLYIIMSGSVEIIKKIKDNEETLLATMGANEIIGEMSLIDSEPRTATARTSEDSVLIVITKQKFNEILQSDPRIAAKILLSLLRIINKRLRIMDKKLEGVKTF